MSKENKKKDFWLDLQEESLGLCFRVIEDFYSNANSDIAPNTAKKAAITITEFYEKGQTQLNRNQEIFRKYNDIAKRILEEDLKAPSPSFYKDSEKSVETLADSSCTSRSV